MNRNVDEYLNLSYSTYVVPDITTDQAPCYLAYHPELEGCMSHGDTPEEAINNLREATELYISTLIEMGIEVPEPQGIEFKWDVFVVPNEIYADVQSTASVPQSIPV